MLEYARWKYTLIGVVLALALLFALPNFFGEDPALQIARRDRVALDDGPRHTIEDFLKEKKIPFTSI